MYYEEKVINGILCWRGDPKGEWHEMDYVELLSNYESTKRNYYEYALLAQELKESRDAWRKLAERATLKWEVWTTVKGTLFLTCIHCGYVGYRVEDIAHSPDCPIEQLRKLKEREGC